MAKALLQAVAMAAALGLLAACGAPQGAATLAPATVTTLGVNAYLWRAAVETLAFMPLTQVEANSGVLVTDWYSNPKVPGERVRVNLFVMDRDLRADGLRIVVLRQEVRQGAWVDAPVRAGSVQRLEEAVLTRARQLRQSSIVPVKG